MIRIAGFVCDDLMWLKCVVTHFGKVSFNELVGFLPERYATVLLGKVRNTNRIGWIELALQEGTARLYYVWHLEHGSGRQQLAHRYLGHPYVTGVHEEQDSGHRRWTNLYRTKYIWISNRVECGNSPEPTPCSLTRDISHSLSPPVNMALK